MSRARRWLLLAALVVLLGHAAAATAPPAGAYAEDECPALVGGGWMVCEFDIDASVCEAGSLAYPCQSLVGLTRLGLQQVVADGSRSTLHTDATYLLAQAAGFTPREALAIAIYDGATDFGGYTHRDRRGAVVAGVSSGAVAGVKRTNFTGGGVFLHFMTPLSGPGPALNGASVVTQDQARAGAPLPGLDGLRPDPTDPVSEPVLANARAWVYGRGPLCVAGLTERSPRGDYATGARCYARPDGSPGQLLASIPFSRSLGETSNLNWTSRLGELQMTLPGAEHPVPASKLASVAGSGRAPYAALGIYLHALQDRVSHHVCIDRSYLLGPRPAGAPAVLVNALAFAIGGTTQGGLSQLFDQGIIAHPDFVLTLDDRECDQSNHDARHKIETGHDQSKLKPADRTTAAGMRATLDELQAYARSATGAATLGHTPHPTGAATDGLLDAIVAAESVHAPQARLDALTALAERRCLLPLPGYSSLDEAAWESQADAAHDDGCARSLGLPAAGACRSRRVLTVHLWLPRGQRLRRAAIRVGTREPLVVAGRGRTRVRVDLRGLPRGRYTVRIVATTTSGRRLTVTRRYRTCRS